MKRDWGILIICYAAISFILFYRFGVKVVNDSPRYLEYAYGLKTSFYFDPHNFWYFSYVLFLRFFQLFTSNLVVVVIAQFILNFIATLSLYETSYLLYRSRLTSLICSGSYLLFFEIISWNCYIIPEAFYCAFICFSFYFLTYSYLNKVNLKNGVLSFLAILITILAKPTGLSLLGALLVVLTVYLFRNSKSMVFRISIPLFSALLFFLILNKMLLTFDWLDRDYIVGDIVYGVQTIPDDQNKLSSLYISHNENLYIPNKNLPEIIRIVSFILHNPTYWFTLFIHKAWYFLSHTRPYWSIRHNAYSLLYFFIIYLGSMKSLLRKGSKLLKLFGVSYFLLHMSAVCFSTVDWDGRFILPLIPILCIASSISLTNVLTTWLTASRKFVSLTLDKT